MQTFGAPPMHAPPWQVSERLHALPSVQGLPFGFFAQSLPVMLRKQGFSLGEIGLSSLLAVPWALGDGRALRAIPLLPRSFLLSLATFFPASFTLALVTPVALRRLLGDQSPVKLDWHGHNDRGLGLINASPLHMGILTEAGPPAWHPAPAHGWTGPTS